MRLFKKKNKNPDEVVQLDGPRILPVRQYTSILNAKTWLPRGRATPAVSQIPEVPYIPSSHTPSVIQPSVPQQPVQKIPRKPVIVAQSSDSSSYDARVPPPRTVYETNDTQIVMHSSPGGSPGMVQQVPTAVSGNPNVVVLPAVVETTTATATGIAVTTATAAATRTGTGIAITTAIADTARKATLATTGDTMMTTSGATVSTDTGAITTTDTETTTGAGTATMTTATQDDTEIMTGTATATADIIAIATSITTSYTRNIRPPAKGTALIATRMGSTAAGITLAVGKTVTCLPRIMDSDTMAGMENMITGRVMAKDINIPSTPLGASMQPWTTQSNASPIGWNPTACLLLWLRTSSSWNRIIGIDYQGQSSELKGCINDARDVRDFLVKRCRFKKEDIMLLTDDKSRSSRSYPSRANMISAMKWLVEGAQMHDSLFLHYSGHGGQKRDFNDDEADGYDETIFPVDHEEAGVIIDDEMHKILVDPLPAACRLTALFDSCHSGTVLDLPYIYSQHGRLRGSHVSPRARLRQASPADVITWSACRDGQTSVDTFAGGEAVGAMSYAFLKILRNERDLSYSDLLKRLRRVLGPNFKQTPQLGSSHPILGAPCSPDVGSDLKPGRSPMMAPPTKRPNLAAAETLG
ncbi:caspase domain-containing protein [Schizophyllum commune]